MTVAERMSRNLAGGARRFCTRFFSLSRASGTDSTVSYQPLDQVFVTSTRGLDDRRVALVVLLLEVAVVPQQRLHELEVPTVDRVPER